MCFKFPNFAAKIIAKYGIKTLEVFRKSSRIKEFL